MEHADTRDSHHIRALGKQSYASVNRKIYCAASFGVRKAEEPLYVPGVAWNHTSR